MLDELPRPVDFYRAPEGILRSNLENNAVSYASAEFIRRRCDELLGAFNIQDRATAIRIGGGLAISDSVLLARLSGHIENEPSEAVRHMFLYSINRPIGDASIAREVALVQLRRLEVDSSINVMDTAAWMFRRSITQGVLKKNDLSRVLIALFKAAHPWRRTQLGKAAVEFSLEKDFAVNESIHDEAFSEFVRYYESHRKPSDLSDGSILAMWETWWTTNKQRLSGRSTLVLVP
ncbi:MAG: hypothetical protein ABIR80_03225 [Opitutaceae bacterium]